jgi:hypothetical protein
MPRKSVRLHRSVEEIFASASNQLSALKTEPAQSKEELQQRLKTIVELSRDVRELTLRHCQQLLPQRSAFQRLLAYLKMNIGQEVEGEELDVLSAISEWPRRIREWRVEKGWPIRARGSSYILESDEPDSKGAQIWKSMNSIRRTNKAARDKMLDLFLAFPGEPLSTDDIRYVTKGKDMRRLRELRTELGWRILTRNTGRPDLRPDEYILINTEPMEEHDRHIEDKVVAKVMMRDGCRCQKAGCHWHPKEKTPGDPRQYIELHHINWHSTGGTNDPENLITLCNVHHKDVHRMKVTPEKLGEWLQSTD